MVFYACVATLERLKVKGDEEGFMLIQLVILTIVLAILATIVILTVGTTTKGPRRLLAPAANAAYASCKSTTVETVKAGLEVYKAEAATGTFPATLTMLTSKTTVNTDGPWLKTAPNTTATPSGLAKYGWAITTYSSTAGTFKVATAHGPPRPTSTRTVCKGA